MKTHLQWLNVSNGERQLNREMSDKEFHTFWYNELMFWPKEDIERHMCSYFSNPSENPVNRDAFFISLCKEILADRGE